jgi:hypothetical protein
MVKRKKYYETNISLRLTKEDENKDHPSVSPLSKGGIKGGVFSGECYRDSHKEHFEVSIF